MIRVLLSAVEFGISVDSCDIRGASNEMLELLLDPRCLSHWHISSTYNRQDEVA